MANMKKRPLIDRLRDLFDHFTRGLEPRRPARVPIPVNEQLRRR